jgi:hypothetical protein
MPPLVKALLVIVIVMFLPPAFFAYAQFSVPVQGHRKANATSMKKILLIVVQACFKECREKEVNASSACSNQAPAACSYYVVYFF